MAELSRTRVDIQLEITPESGECVVPLNGEKNMVVTDAFIRYHEDGLIQVHVRGDLIRKDGSRGRARREAWYRMDMAQYQRVPRWLIELVNENQPPPLAYNGFNGHIDPSEV